MQGTTPRIRRKLSVLLSALLSLSIVIAGTCFIVKRTDSNIADVPTNIPTYARGASDIMMVHGYVGQPDDYTETARRADIVVEGVIEELFPSKWTTMDNETPANPRNVLITNPAVHIRTPVRLTVERIFKGENIGHTLIFSFVGGRVGDTAMVVEGNQDYEPGRRIIVFLKRSEADHPASIVHPSGLWLSSPHLVVDGDVAHGPLREIPMEELVQQLQQGQ